MFRKMRRFKQQISKEECAQILREQPRGVLSMIGDDGYPYGIPLDHWYCEEDNRLYFHCAKVGHKIDAISACDKVSYCVVGEGTHKDGDWAKTYRSVIVFGRVRLLDDYGEAMDVVRRLSLQFTDDTDYIEHEIEQYGGDTLVFALIPEHMTGKTIREA